MKTVNPKPSVNGTLIIPGSKSLSHRALIASALARGKSRLEGFLSCEDTLFTANALRLLGADLSLEGSRVTVVGNAGHFAAPRALREIYLGNSGTSFRLLLSIAALSSGSSVLTGTNRMHERPIGDLVEALKALGARISYHDCQGYPPLLTRGGGLHGGKVIIPGNKSSQFLSSLLLAGPYAREEVEIEVTGTLVSRPYVDITLGVMDDFGIPVARKGYRWFKIPSGITYQARSYIIEGDVSTASYFWAAAAVTGGSITTENIRPGTVQGDIGLLRVLEKMGCHVKRFDDRISVMGGHLTGIEVDMGAMPDMVPTLAAIALFAEGETVIRNVSHLRIKESDRLHAIAQEWRRIGAAIEELEDGIVIQGGRPLAGTSVNSHNDHRIAMSLAVIGLNVKGIEIGDEECVTKSFPAFWSFWDAL